MVSRLPGVDVTKHPEPFFWRFGGQLTFLQSLRLRIHRFLFGVDCDVDPLNRPAVTDSKVTEPVIAPRRKLVVLRIYDTS